MNLIYKVNETIAPLSWCTFVNGGTAYVCCGRAVETRDDFFVEGAWDASFADGNFPNAEWFCGSGGKINENSIVFSTPTHVTSALYIIKDFRGGCWVSNSQYLLMALTGYSYDAQYKYYEKDYNSILEGINQYKKSIFTIPTELIQICYFRNIIVTNAGDITISIKRSIAPFINFHDYKKRLNKAINSLVENAKDPNRKQKYGSVTTISKGYDAPCCAVIAKNSGCRTAVTFKAEGKYAEDSGIEIAQILGYEKIIEKDALEYLQREDIVEAEYICSGELGAQISFSAFDNEFTGNLVFTGDRGDSIWGFENPICNNEFHFIDFLNHLGTCERKLWVGYIPVPIPLFGATAWTSIQRISQSKEMAYWSLGNDYDRPIPRRICEEAGVRREMFGISKHGAGFTYRYDSLKRMKSRMAPTTGKAFEEYVKNHAHYDPIEVIKYYWKIKNLFLIKLGVRVKPLSSIELKNIINPTAVKYLIPWSGTLVIDKYKKALGAENEYFNSCCRNSE